MFNPSLSAQGERTKLEVLLALLEEVPDERWLLWADNDALFANRGFSFPFHQYEAAGKHLVIAGDEAGVLAGNAHREAPAIYIPYTLYTLCAGCLCVWVKPGP